MLALILLAQVATATPLPTATLIPATPRPEAHELAAPQRDGMPANTSATRTLADVARERRGKGKPAGTFSVAGAPAGPSDGKAAPSVTWLRTEAVSFEAPDSIGSIWVRGRVTNAGTVKACGIQIAVDVVAGGKSLSKETYSSPSDLGPGESGSFSTFVTSSIEARSASASVLNSRPCK